MSVEKARSGNGWFAVWDEPRLKGEKRHKRARLFTLKRDAQAFDREMRRRKALGPLAVQQLTERGPTLGQWIAERWMPEHGVTLERSTLARYRNVYACHVAQLDDVPLGELTVARLRVWQAELVKVGVNAGTIQKARTFLSSVLRHAAESEAIAANPLSNVRAPKPQHRDAVTPLSPVTVEAIRRALLDPRAREIAPSHPGQRQRRGYEISPTGTPQTRHRDALVVSLLAYGGVRPGELRALRWSDVREQTLLVERAADPEGEVKATKNEHRRAVKLLSPLVQDLREYRLTAGRPPDPPLIFPGDDGRPWTKAQWQVWRRDRWAPACRVAGLAPRPYDLRHSFASLLLAEGHRPLYVARQLGHSLTVLLSTYAHLIDEYEGRERVDAEAEITRAREQEHARGVRLSASDVQS